MYFIVRVKFWLFQYYWWLLCPAIALVVTGLFLAKEPISTQLPVIGTLLSLAYFLQKQKLKEMKLFREIFKECNARYDQMNEKLAVIIRKKSPANLNQTEQAQIVDYLNLCAEEYLYFQAGYIDFKVWQAWLYGMHYFAEKQEIRCLWQHELEQGSYYGFSLALVDDVVKLPRPEC
jgi:hypothetical protein